MTSQSFPSTTQGPSSVVSYGRLAAVPAPSYSQKIARMLMTAETWLVSIGGVWGLDLATFESCELCGGFYPPKGDAVLFLTEAGEPLYVHTGCHQQLEDWI